MDRFNPQTPWLTLLNWLWLAGMMSMGLYAVWDSGLLRHMIATDRTYLCLLILAVFLAASLHCAWRSYRLSRENISLLDSRRYPDSAINTYFRQLAETSDSSNENRQLLTEWLGEQLRGQHQVGWFVTATLIKLGLLGTVIGFVIMLGSLGKLESLETAQVQTLMEQMTHGMGIALNTTLLGLVGSILLGLQYLYLDRSADRLLASVIRQGHQPDSLHGPV